MDSCVGFFFLCKGKTRRFVLRISPELVIGRERSPRSDRVAINTSRERFFPICILHKHKPATWEPANEPGTRGLCARLPQVLSFAVGGGTSGLLRWVLEHWEANGDSTASTLLGTVTQHLPQEGGLDCLVSPGAHPLSSSYLQRGSSPLLLQRSGRKLRIRGHCPPYPFPNPVPSPTGPSAPWTEPGGGIVGKPVWLGRVLSGLAGPLCRGASCLQSSIHTRLPCRRWCRPAGTGLRESPPAQT